MMRKLLITAVCCASVISTGCSSMHIPGVYKVDVPQGNIVTQAMVDQLHTGMSKRQVNYAMGTPLVVDVFHPERWDYIYSFQQGGHKPDKHHVTLYFENDQLTRIEGDYQPHPGSASTVPAKETTVTVTPPPAKQGFFSRLFGSKKQPTITPDN